MDLRAAYSAERLGVTVDSPAFSADNPSPYCRNRAAATIIAAPRTAALPPAGGTLGRFPDSPARRGCIPDHGGARYRSHRETAMNPSESRALIEKVAKDRWS
jgi:hypothetical protein